MGELAKNVYSDHHNSFSMLLTWDKEVNVGVQNCFETGLGKVGHGFKRNMNI